MGCASVLWCGPEDLVSAGLVDGAECEDGVESVDGPVHAGSFGALFDDGVAGCFHGAGADVVAVGAEVGVLHAVVVAGEVADLGGGGFGQVGGGRGGVEGVDGGGDRGGVGEVEVVDEGLFEGDRVDLGVG